MTCLEFKKVPMRSTPLCKQFLHVPSCCQVERHRWSVHQQWQLWRPRWLHEELVARTTTAAAATRRRSCSASRSSGCDDQQLTTRSTAVAQQPWSVQGGKPSLAKLILCRIDNTPSRMSRSAAHHLSLLRGAAAVAAVAAAAGTRPHRLRLHGDVKHMERT